MHRRHLLVWVVALAVAPLAAQSQRPRAELTPTVETVPVRPGAAAQLSLKVTLPKDVHVQSDAPRDPNLIATALTIDAPVGVTVESIEYPEPTDLMQAGAAKPLAVFGSEFAIAVTVSVAATLPEGDVNLPAVLRYQACNASVCFPPTRATAQWTLKVQPAGAVSRGAVEGSSPASRRGRSPARSVPDPAAP